MTGEDSRWDALNRDQLVAELTRSNRLLSGTLHIVLSTLDSLDVGVLISRVLNELTTTLDATGAIMYVVEQDGFHLRGTSSSINTVKVPAYVRIGRTLETMTARKGHAMRLRMLAPEEEELRRGKLADRRLQDEDTQEIYMVDALSLPPFMSMLAVPVWFGQSVVAIVEVGWSHSYLTRSDEASLLEAVAQYLSVQLVGAFSAMRQRREAELAEAAARIQTMVLASGDVDDSSISSAIDQMADELDATCYPLMHDKRQMKVTIACPDGTQEILPFESEILLDGLNVIPINPASALHDWLEAHSLPCVGALVSVSLTGDVRHLALLLRPRGSEPLDATELSFIRRVMQSLRHAAEGKEARKQDKCISQALQRGMRNELQQVDGITADAVYSSATATAFVGGDFYDLIALPHGRACIIMGDVSGKGIEAASVSAAVKTALAAYAWEGLQPAQMVEHLNDYLLSFSRVETFATLFVGIMDLDNAALTYCSAGHPPVILRHADTGELVALDVQSGVVGAFSDIVYRNGHIGLAAGDMLLLYTDGITEARSPNGAFFGEDALRDAIVREAPEGVTGLPERLLTTLDSFTGRNLSDDIAIVAVRIDRVGS